LHSCSYSQDVFFHHCCSHQQLTGKKEKEKEKKKEKEKEKEKEKDAMQQVFSILYCIDMKQCRIHAHATANSLYSSTVVACIFDSKVNQRENASKDEHEKEGATAFCTTKEER
jgi:hypothetical protein